LSEEPEDFEEEVIEDEEEVIGCGSDIITI